MPKGHRAKTARIATELGLSQDKERGSLAVQELNKLQTPREIKELIEEIKAIATVLYPIDATCRLGDKVLNLKKRTLNTKIAALEQLGLATRIEPLKHGGFWIECPPIERAPLLTAFADFSLEEKAAVPALEVDAAPSNRPVVY